MFICAVFHGFDTGLFYSGYFEEEEVIHESMLVIGSSLDAIWTTLAFAKSPGMMLSDLVGDRFIRSSAMWGCPRGVMVKAMDCGIVVREFVLQSRYYVHFRANTLGKGMNPFILPARRMALALNNQQRLICH